MALDPANGRVLDVMDLDEPVVRIANSSLKQFSECIRAVIDLFPYYHEGADFDEIDAATGRISAKLNDIDPVALEDPDGFWRTFVDDVQMGDYATEVSLRHRASPISG
jgi:hypothetical protein